MVTGLVVLFLAAAFDISVASTDQSNSGTTGRIHNVIFGWFGSDEDKDESAPKDADEDSSTVDQDRAVPEQDHTPSQPGMDRDVTRDADPGASSNTMNMDRGSADIDTGVDGDTDTGISSDIQPGTTTDNLPNRVAFDQPLEQSQDADRDSSLVDQDQSILDQDRDQVQEQDSSVLPDQDSPVTTPDTSPTDRDAMGIAR